MLDLLGYDGHISLFVLVKDSCSEVSRLAGWWLKQRSPRSTVLIAKGKIKDHWHDVLLVGDGRSIVIIDPTVWQFFKHKRTIYMAKTKTTKLALAELTKIYGGKWKISEQIKNYSKR